MAKFQVVRTFPSAFVLSVGQIVEDPEWHNLDLLVGQGYLRRVEADEKPPAATEQELGGPVEEKPQPAAKKVKKPAAK